MSTPMGTIPADWATDPKGDTAYGYVIRERVGTNDDYSWHVADQGIWTAQPYRYEEPTWDDVKRLTDEWNDEYSTHLRSMTSFPVRLIDGEWARTAMRVWHPY